MNEEGGVREGVECVDGGVGHGKGWRGSKGVICQVRAKHISWLFRLAYDGNLTCRVTPPHTHSSHLYQWPRDPDVKPLQSSLWRRAGEHEIDERESGTCACE